MRPRLACCCGLKVATILIASLSLVWALGGLAVSLALVSQPEDLVDVVMDFMVNNEKEKTAIKDNGKHEEDLKDDLHSMVSTGEMTHRAHHIAGLLAIGSTMLVFFVIELGVNTCLLHAARKVAAQDTSNCSGEGLLGGSLAGHDWHLPHRPHPAVHECAI